MAKPTTNTKEKKTRGSSIDEAAAFAFYIKPKKNGRLVSYEEVAKKFGVVPRTIENIGRKNDWVQRREKLGEMAVVETIKTVGEQMRDKNIEHMREFELLAAQGREMLNGTMEAFRKKLAKKKFSKNELHFSAVVADIAKGLLVEGIKGQRVTLGLPTDVTKSMALNLNLNEELPRDEIERMQQFLDANFNKSNGATAARTDN